MLIAAINISWWKGALPHDFLSFTFFYQGWCNFFQGHNSDRHILELQSKVLEFKSNFSEELRDRVVCLERGGHQNLLKNIKELII